MNNTLKDFEPNIVNHWTQAGDCGKHFKEGDVIHSFVRDDDSGKGRVLVETIHDHNGDSLQGFGHWNSQGKFVGIDMPCRMELFPISK